MLLCGSHADCFPDEVLREGWVAHVAWSVFIDGNT